MILTASRSHTRWIRQFGALLWVFLGCCSPSGRTQDLEKPLFNIDEEITAFAYAPDGRIVYSVRRAFKTKRYDLQHDDIWLQDAGGKRRRLLQGEKFTHGNTPFSYTVDSFRWSPNGRLILAQLFTTSVIDDTGKTEDSPMALAIDDTGREIHLVGSENIIPDSLNGTWLADNSTLVYLSESVKPHILYSIKAARISAGSVPFFYDGRTFLDAAWTRGLNFGIAVEQDRSLSGPPRLQRVELVTENDKELATLDGYAGGISISPSGQKVAYFIDKEILEVRDLGSPNRIARLRVGLGVFHWSGDETRILLKRAIEKKSGDLVWIDLPPLSAHSPDHDTPVSQPIAYPILHDLTFRDFAISSDGRFLAVVATGKRNLLVFPLLR
jgi:dipeptidyl aminopeptidase/acylaminoacyl peptidase